MKAPRGSQPPPLFLYIPSAKLSLSFSAGAVIISQLQTLFMMRVIPCGFAMASLHSKYMVALSSLLGEFVTHRCTDYIREFYSDCSGLDSFADALGKRTLSNYPGCFS